MIVAVSHVVMVECVLMMSMTSPVFALRDGLEKTVLWP